jgi:hypothetical protein
MRGRSPLRIILGIVMLGAVYVWSYNHGVVQSFTQAIHVTNPGPLQVPSPIAAVTQASPAGGTTGTDRMTPAEVQATLTTLGSLRVAGRAPMTGYTRAQFGQAWADVDRNGCDTRNDILRRDLTGVTFKAGTLECVVAAGTLADPYTGKTITFIRGTGTSTVVQIDHVVALSDAWQKGAQALSAVQRTAFANDPRNLLAVDGPTNTSKGDGDAATWLPPNKAFRCEYVTMQVQVKATYSLWVTTAEHDAIIRVLGAC